MYYEDSADGPLLNNKMPCNPSCSTHIPGNAASSSPLDASTTRCETNLSFGPSGTNGTILGTWVKNKKISYWFYKTLNNKSQFNGLPNEMSASLLTSATHSRVQNDRANLSI